jgi:hypothetical protein
MRRSDGPYSTRIVKLHALAFALAVALAFTLLPMSAQAAAPRELAPEQVRTAFARAGYVVSEPSVWTDEAVLFMVRDPADGPADRPVLRVFIFLNAAVAAEEHRRAHLHDEARRNRTIADSDDHGPQLLAGYGASVWRANVALVQASPPDDVGAFPVEPNCDPEPVITASTRPELASRDYALPVTGVDRRYVELLDGPA